MSPPSRKRPASRSTEGSATPQSSEDVRGVMTFSTIDDAFRDAAQASPSMASVPFSTSPTGMATVRNPGDGQQHGVRKRPAHGQAQSPQQYVHGDNISYFDEQLKSHRAEVVAPSPLDTEHGLETSHDYPTTPTTLTTDSVFPPSSSYNSSISSTVPAKAQPHPSAAGDGAAFSANEGQPSPTSSAAAASPAQPITAVRTHTPRAPSSSFAMPGAPQSARHHQSAKSPPSKKPPLVTNELQNQSTDSMLSSAVTSASSPFAPPTGVGRGSGSGSGSGGSGSGSRSNGSGAGGDSFGSSIPHHRNTMSNVRPYSRFANYSETVGSRMPNNTHVAMLDLDESIRALYFAPIPLVVLDHTRSIKMLNRPAEALLGISDSNSVGVRLDRYVAPGSRQHFNLALNEMAQGVAFRTSQSAIPYSTRVVMQPADGPSITAEMNISSWFALDPIFSANHENRSSHNTGQSSSEHSPGSYNSPTSPYDAAQRAGPQPVHEAFFTLSFVPTRTGRRDSPNSIVTPKTMADQLRETIVDHIDVAVIAVSKDTKVVVQNDPSRELFRVLRGGAPDTSDEPKNEDSSAMEVEEGESNELHFRWITDYMTCWDEKFENPFPQEDWPVYRCAVLGQLAPSVLIGCESKITGERVLLEVSGRPLRDRGGFGDHIGGIIVMRNVTADQLKMRQQVRHEGDIYFRQTCDAMPQLVWVGSASGYIEWYSTSWFEYTGQTPAESRGVGWQAVIHEEDFGEAASRWSHSLRTGELYEVAYRLLGCDNSYRWFLGRALPIRDSDTGKIQRWFGTCTDIHDQVEALSSSRRAQAQLENVINHAAMTIWATDRQGRITVAEGPGVRQLKLLTPGTPGSASERQKTTTQDGERSDDGNAHTHSTSNQSNSVHSHHRANMVGRSIYSIWDPALIGESMERALKGETVVEEMEIEGRWFRTSYTPMRAQQDDPNRVIDSTTCETSGDGEVIGVVGASLDITDRKRAQARIEETLLEKTRALAAEGAAREASRLKSEFLANMSHEIRTPIAGVIGLSELLLDEKGLSAQQRDYAETIQRSAEGLLTVINDVLDFSKVEIGKLDVERAPFNLEVLLRDAKRMLSFATQKKGLEFRESLDLTYKEQVLGDVGRLRQVLTNLLTNAIKFTSAGYISLEVTELSEDAENFVVKFDVRDTGCGISKDTLSRLFQPFSQADPSTARRFGGTGLGLSISKNLVELMQGTIGLESVEGEGSHAWFVIPFRKASEREKARHISQTQGANQDASATINTGFSMVSSEEDQQTILRPRKDVWILIAEDNVVNAQIASKNIKRMGFNCRTAENGLKALEELGKNSYDAILMDCQMPECDGYEATRMIRKSLNPDIRMLPIIALTASAIKGDRERALEAGMVDYLAKPVKRPALEATLCKWLYDSNARQSLSQFMVPVAERPQPVELVEMDISYDPLSAPLPVSAGSMASIEASAFPFPSASTISTAMESEAMTPSTTRRLANVRLSPSSEAVIERLKTPDEHLGDEALSYFRSGDALSAAAVLLSARRSSADELERIRSEAAERRPSPTLRSHSYQGKNENIWATTQPFVAAKSKLSAGVADTTITPHPLPELARLPSYVRSDRGQAGLGRDLDAELLRATDPDPPALHAAMSSDETLPSLDSDPKLPLN